MAFSKFNLYSQELQLISGFNKALGFPGRLEILIKLQMEGPYSSTIGERSPDLYGNRIRPSQDSKSRASGHCRRKISIHILSHSWKKYEESNGSFDWLFRYFLES
jgi:hypothetical protein